MKKEDNRNSDKLSPLILLLILTIVLLIISFLVTYYIFEKWEERGSFGDSFGMINALFSGLAFGGIIYTILLQRKELELQRNELSETRKELKRSADAQENSEKALLEQIKTMKRTAILNGYNSIIEFHNSFSQLLVSDGKSHLVDPQKAGKYVSKIQELLSEMEEEDKNLSQ